MQIKSTLLLIAGIILGLSACSTEKSAPDYNHLGYQYYPVEVGDYNIYDVENIDFSFLDGADTSQYQLKEVVQDYFQQNNEDTSYYLYRYSRITDQDDWELDSVWTVRKDTRRIVVVENNVPIIKLVFPATVGLNWDANGLNGEEAELYTISSIGEPFQKGDVHYDETLHIVEENNMDTVITERYRDAVYAAGVGLVYKEIRYIDYCNTSVECLGQGIIQGGRKYVQILKEHGKE